MPHVQITLLEGRTQDQKRKLARRVTDALVEEYGANRDAVTLAIVEVTRDDFARDGTLISDRK